MVNKAPAAKRHHKRVDFQRAVVWLLAAVMILSCLPALAFAAEPEEAGNETTALYPASIEATVSVKQDADAASVKSAIESKIKADNSTLPIASFTWPNDTDFTTSGSVNVGVTYSDNTTATASVTFTSIAPSGVAFEDTLSAIDATDAKNASQSSLLAYVNSALALVNNGSNEYIGALGTGASAGNAPSFTWAMCDTQYNPMGGTYTFTQSYNGETLTRVVRVNSVTYDVGSLSLDYSNGTINTTTGMRWSLNRNGSWSNCSANMKIPSTWYDEVVYFYMPATRYASESSVTWLYIPEKADKPDGKLELTSTSHSITIENLWDFDYFEFRLGDGSWRTTKSGYYTFDNLDDNKSYTIQLRTKADHGDNFASDPISASIKTKEAITTKVELDKSYTGNSGAIVASAVVEPRLSGKNMSGNLDTADLSKFTNTVESYIEKFRHVDTSLTINHYLEEDEDVFLTGSTFSLPMSAIKKAIKDADMTLEYRSDLGRVYFSNSALEKLCKNYGTLSIDLKTVTSFSGNYTKWLKSAYNDGAVVYKVNTTCGSNTANVEYFLPYELDKSETVSELNVYFVDSKGNRESLSYEYDTTLRGVRFSLDENGYVAIYADGVDTNTLPFYDVPDTHWARSYIRYCYNRGLFVGTSATTFSPNLSVDKSQIIALLARLDDFDGKMTSTKLRFTDVNTADWYAPYAQWAQEKGLVTGNTFGAKDTMTREDIAKLLYTYLQKANKLDKNFNANKVENYADNNDISSGCRTAVQYMRYVGVMGGVGNNAFAPKATVDRAQMATIMQRMVELLV